MYFGLRVACPRVPQIVRGLGIGVSPQIDVIQFVLIRHFSNDDVRPLLSKDRIRVGETKAAHIR